ncbi:MAG: DoxX family membrane protein [Candidatus Micrarchaeota archaeon]|nr:DoxX family membrane protein [Candidatus Micrarchaeota archaeon]
MRLNNQNIRHLLTRLSLATIFIGIGVWEIVQPSYWSYYVPTFFNAYLNSNTFTLLHGILLVVLGAAVLFGIYLRIAALLCVIVMLTIVADLVTQFQFTDLVIRDLAVLVIAAALYFDDTRYLRLLGK